MKLSIKLTLQGSENPMLRTENHLIKEVVAKRWFLISPNFHDLQLEIFPGPNPSWEWTKAIMEIL